MFDHIGIIVKDAARALAFYEAALEPLALTVIQRHPNGAFIIGEHSTDRFLYMGPDAPSFWTSRHVSSRSPIHVCFHAPTREAVDAFYDASLAHGGADNGPPGERETGYYAAYVIDPDGNNIEAAFREQK